MSDKGQPLATALDAAKALTDAAAARQEAPLYTDEGDSSVTTGKWQIQGLEDVEWALSRIRDLQAEKLEHRALLAEAERRVARMDDKADRGIEFFTWHILRWMKEARERLLKHGSKKSRDLINGRIGWRASADRLVVKDHKELLAWVQEQDVELGLVRVKLEPDIAAIRKYAQEHDLVPPGMEDEKGEDEPYIAVNPPDRSLLATKG